YRPVIVAWRQGSPVRLQEVAQVWDSVENDKVASWYTGTRAVVLSVQRQPGTNTVEVVDAIRQLLPTFRAQMPAAVNLEVLADRSEAVRDSVQDVKFTLLLSLALVVMVIFLFLRNLSATAIPSMALPMSIVGTFAVMYLLGYSLDNLSLMALTLSVGFVVDDAIVMLENIVRHMELGEGVFEAALKGAREIGFTIISMTLSLAAVFIPVLFMGFIPSEDTSQVFGFTEAAQDISFDAMVKHQQQVAAIIRQDPNVESFTSSVGASGPNGTGNTGRVFLRLKPRSERALSADELI